jgi:uncharacterized protein (TIRG00374 family)
MVLLADIRRTGHLLAGFDSSMLPLLVALPLSNYALRFLKWEFLLRRTGVRIRPGRSAIVFLAGMSMTVSPGKLGEVLKSCLLRDREGIPVVLTSPVVLAERITDLLSMLVLAAVGVALDSSGRSLPALAAGVAACALAIASIRSGRLFGMLTGLLCRMRFFAARREALCSFRTTATALLTPGNLLVTVPLGVLSWGAEAAVVLAAARAIGFAPDAGAALLAYSVGTIAGAVSMIPGGLGLTELTMGGLLSPSLGSSGAAAVTIVTRFATLWFAVGIGLAFLGLERASGTPAVKACSRTGR